MAWSLVLLLFQLQSVAPARPPAIGWATFAVEREAFKEGQPGQYATTGQFDGIGMFYFSVERQMLEYKGLRRISLGYLGQGSESVYEFRNESFETRSIIRISDTEYAFEAILNGPFSRTVTGKLRYSVAKGAFYGRVEEFNLDEHGELLKGVMNRFKLAQSPTALSMLKKYSEIFFGGNVVTLEFVK